MKERKIYCKQNYFLNNQSNFYIPYFLVNARIIITIKYENKNYYYIKKELTLIDYSL